MSEKTVKGKRAEQSVLGSLSSTRPSRLARPRDGAEPRPSAANGTKAKPARAAAKPKPAAAKPKPSAARRSKPEAVSAGSPQLKLPAQGRAVPPPPEREGHSGPPTGIELVTTAVQAAGEVAQIGVSVGGRILKRAVRRLPHP